MKVALIHDYLNQYGGGERVLGTLCELFPRAPIYTLLYDEKATGGAFVGRRIFTSWLQKLPGASRFHRSLAMLMPLAVEQFDLSKYDLVISNSASFAKGVITKPRTKHISYCMTPTRFLWDDSHKFLRNFRGAENSQRNQWPNADFVSLLASPFLSYLRVWDQQASQRVDEFIAISHFIQARIKKYYKRDSGMIYPPVDTKKFFIANELGDYFLMVGRLVPYKRFDLAVRVFTQLGWPLKIIGSGPQLNYLKSIAGKNVEFLGLLSDHLLPEYYARAQALVFPQEEDFGIVAVEAMASGRPVIAFQGGGSTEIIKAGETGIFFAEQTEPSLLAALQAFRAGDFNPQQVRGRALLFDQKIFKQQFMATVEAVTRGPVAPVAANSIRVFNF
ncbi:MAG: hypothetical protein A3I32_00415 [Candidatus Yanofskybacteria bacterium RIFCSPLOWO2_02_FULL_45_10]|uniref:Uncharacterized protein n=2 Tax=Candidatus Yanofskyibacteriota TaxID=1752733 RepID=A0A1F8G123_9BACT|nr:MAG: hypothetical protein A3F25_02980 [Candidatus Yanofskybacteria bacterium RIFCSPHIGHO2_12_FULL_45_19b]OGN31545.1 MAG: hypothetical protein A3I32_00415 [Candidatus Yanofskybacteria bacterium RIFCSPLOWO2_02_FULL_45_10]